MASTHLILGMQRASGSTVSADLMNNIQMKIVLGAFDSGVSNNLFERDITNRQRPEIKGRAFMNSGNDIFEVQTYWVDPIKDYVFDENLRETYNNPIFLAQKYGSRNALVPEKDLDGFIEQKHISEEYIEEIQEEDIEEDFVEDEFEDEENFIEEPPKKENKTFQLDKKLQFIQSNNSSDKRTIKFKINK